MSFIVTLRDWKHMAITQEILSEIKKRQTQAKEELASGMGRDPFEYGFRVGAIAAYQDFLDIELDDDGTDRG